MKVAYLILAHHKPRQFAWLFEALRNPVDLFLLHVDAKADDATRAAILRTVAGQPNVHVLPSRPLLWGGWSIGAIQLDAIRAALALDAAWTHFANLSGQDYPLRPADAIRADLAADPGRNHVQAATFDAFPPGDRAHLVHRRRYLRFEWNGRIVGTPFPRIPWDGIRIRWKGSGWFTLTRAFCAWIASDRQARRCVRAVRRTYVPDEFLLQTLAMNGPFASTLAEDNRREILWDGSAHPLTLTMAHRDRLLASTAHFARKFDEDTDAEILDLLARRIGAPAPVGG